MAFGKYFQDNSISQEAADAAGVERSVIHTLSDFGRKLADIAVTGVAVVAVTTVATRVIGGLGDVFIED